MEMRSQMQSPMVVMVVIHVHVHVDTTDKAMLTKNYEV